MAFKFEELRVWRQSVELSNKLSHLISLFPPREKYVLSSQIMRASDSIFLNIAEGSTGQSNAEFKKFLGYSIRSGIEIIACLHLARGRKLIDENQFHAFYTETERLVISIQALRNAIR